MNREDRYIVVKRSDVASYLSIAEQQQLAELLDLIIQAKKISDPRAPKQYVVVAEDWPMYEDTWRAIEDWVDSGHPK